MTPAETEALFKSIKTGFANIIKAELIPAGPVVVGEKIPLVLPRLVVDPNHRAWAAKLASPRHIVDTIPQVHAIMIGSGGEEQLTTKSVGTVDYRLRWSLTAYYQEYPGTDNDNAEDNLAGEIARIAALFVGRRNKSMPDSIKSNVLRIHGFKQRKGLARMGIVFVRTSIGEFYTDLQPIDKV